MDAPTLTKLVGEISKAAAPKDAKDERSDEDFQKQNTEASFHPYRNPYACHSLVETSRHD